MCLYAAKLCNRYKISVLFVSNILSVTTLSYGVLDWKGPDAEPSRWCGLPFSIDVAQLWISSVFQTQNGWKVFYTDPMLSMCVVWPLLVL